MAMSSSATSGRMRERSVSALRPSWATNTSCPIARSSTASELAASTLSSTIRMRFCTPLFLTTYAVRLKCRLAGDVAPALDRGLDFARIGGLDEVVVEAGRRGARPVFLLPVTRQGDEQHMAGVAPFAQLARHCIAVESGQPDV